MKLRTFFLLFTLTLCSFSLMLRAQELISHKAPVYPLAAKAAAIEGPVTLKGTISKEGKMENVIAVSGPPELRQAAIDAVSEWTYKPYRHFGHVVIVDTTVTVNFAMGRTPADKAEAQAKAKAELAKAAQQETTPKL